MTTNNLSSHSKSSQICSFQDCERPVTCRFFCQKHYVRQKKYGSPAFVQRKHGTGNSFAERFWSRVTKDANEKGCWEWEGPRVKGGYGHVTFKGKTLLTHRVAFRLTFGVNPPPLVRHNCDNPPCCNPEHLVSGTHKQNSEDMVIRGRSLFGEKHNSAVINDEIAVEIFRRFELGETQTQIVRALGLTLNIVHGVVSGRTWKHITRKNITPQETTV